MTPSTFLTNPIRVDSRGGVHETRIHLIDSNLVLTSKEVTALCGRSGMPATTWGPETTPLVFLPANIDAHCCRNCAKRLTRP